MLLKPFFADADNGDAGTAAEDEASEAAAYEGKLATEKRREERERGRKREAEKQKKITQPGDRKKKKKKTNSRVYGAVGSRSGSREGDLRRRISKEIPKLFRCSGSSFNHAGALRELSIERERE